MFGTRNTLGLYWELAVVGHSEFRADYVEPGSLNELYCKLRSEKESSRSSKRKTNSEAMTKLDTESDAISSFCCLDIGIGSSIFRTHGSSVMQA